MALFRTLTLADSLFLASVAGLVVAVVADRWSASGRGWFVAAVSWTAFAAFWTMEAGSYLRDGRAFLLAVSLVTAGLCVYVATLAARGSAPYRRLTVAFAVMGVVFVPYQFVLPVFHAVLSLVTAHTVWGLELIGFTPVVEVGVTGEPSAMRFPNYPRLRYNIVSACTGISAIVLFAGLNSVARAGWRRRVAAGLGTGAVIYLLNVVRTVFVGGAIAGSWFGFAGPVVTPLFGVDHPVLVSFYFAEYLLSQVLVVVALVAVYASLTRFLPGVQSLLATLLDRIEEDRSSIERAVHHSGDGKRTQ